MMSLKRLFLLQRPGSLAVLLLSLALAATVRAAEGDLSLNPVPAPPGQSATPIALTQAAALTPAATATAAGGAQALTPAPTTQSANPLPVSSGTYEGLSAPLYLTAVAGNRAVVLSWYPSEGSYAVSGYLIFRGVKADRIPSTPINLTPVTESSYTDNEANSLEEPENRTTYYYRVRAFSPEGRLSPYSAVVSARPNGPLVPPRKFNGVPGDGKITLTWKAPLSTGDEELKQYVLLKGDSADRMTEYKTFGPKISRVIDRNVRNGKPVFYALIAEDAKGRRSDPTPDLKLIPYVALQPPTGLSLLGLGEDIVRLKWSAPKGAGTFPLKGYNVYRSTGTTVDYAKPLNKALVTDTKFEDESEDSTSAPVLGTVYTYTVVAVDGIDEPSDPSEPIKGGPVPSITKFETGQMQVLGGNTLQIQGRKTLNMSNTWVIQQNPNNTASAAPPSSFALDQQLQVRLSGQVGRKIKVDVDYDDKAASTQQQKISVVYTGDSQEVFKEFAFGDIQMDLSSSRTEFAGYNKSLFGAKLKLDSPDEKLRLTAIGAQTQGFTETKSFVGGYEQVANGTVLGHNYTDTSFIPYKYYYLSRESALLEGAVNITPGSVTIYIDQPGVTNQNPNRVSVVNSSGTTFNFVALNPNVDYVVDYRTGLVSFNTAIQANYTIAVAFATTGPLACGASSFGYNSQGKFDFANSAHFKTTATLGTILPTATLIQDGSTYASSQYDGHMSCQFYSLGDRDILDPKLDPDFKLIVYGSNQSVVYQIDPRTDFSGVVGFDTRLGIMMFRVPYPFGQGNTGANMVWTGTSTGSSDDTALNTGRADAYSLTQKTNNFTVHVEYKHKLASYSLRFNIVHGSESITVDGRHMTRDVDYTLDYDTGILMFNNPDLVKDSSTVLATYEYMPFGGQFTSTVWGGRGEYDFNQNLSVGTTYINDSANTPQQTPDIKSGVYSLQILDGDVQVKAPQKAVDALTAPISPRSGFLKVDASAEAAHSWFNPNTYSRNNENGVGMIDDFESVNSTVAASEMRTSWFPSSIPLLPSGATDTAPTAANRVFTNFTNEVDIAHDAANRTAQGEDPSITMLKLRWHGMSSPANWDSYVYSFGPTPNQSVSQCNLLQLWVKTTVRITLHIDAGQVNEDAIDSGVLATESTTGFLASGEDIGILNSSTSTGSPYPVPSINPAAYKWPDGTDNTGYWGANNNVLDTEDFDQTGALDKTNDYYTYVDPKNPSSCGIVVDPANQNGNNNGYQELLLDLTQFAVVSDNSSNVVLSTVSGSSNYYTNISRLRLWVDNAEASDGTMWIESVQFTGNKWQVRADPNIVSAMTGSSITADTQAFQVLAVNENTAVSQTANVSYVPDTNFYTVDSTHPNTLEQALQLQYSLSSFDMSDGRPYYQARRILSSGSAVDFGQYQKLRLDVYKPATLQPAEVLIVRLAADDQDYFDYSIPLDAVPLSGWTTVTRALDGSDGCRLQVGTPYLRQINYVAFLIRTNNQNLPTVPETLWLNNLRATDSVTRQGTAQRASFTYNLMNGGIVVTQNYHEMDADFIKIDEQANPPQRHTITEDVNTKVNLIRWLPFSVDHLEDSLYTESDDINDPFYSQNFTLPDQTDQKTSANLGFTLVPNVVVNSQGSYQHVRQQFLPAYITQEETNLGVVFSPDNDQENLSGEADLSFKVPQKLPGLGGDMLKVESDYSSNHEAFDQPVSGATNQFSNVDKENRTFKWSYSGTYKIPGVATLSPSFSVSETDARGNIPAPTGTTTTAYYYNYDTYTGMVEDWTPQSRAVNPSLQAQGFDWGPFTHPHATYNFTQTTDYVSNQVRTPGSVELGTGLDFGKWDSAWKAVPVFDFTQSYQVDSTLSNDVLVRGNEQSTELSNWLSGTAQGQAFADRYSYLLDADGGGMSYLPNIALENEASPLESVWWIRAGDGPGILGENLKDPLNVENLAISASRRSTSSLQTHFSMPVFPGWVGNFTPRASITDARIMSAPGEVTENIQDSVGSGIDFKDPRVPFHDWLKPQNLTLNADYSYAENYSCYVENSELTSSRQSMNLRATLPAKPSDLTTLTLSLNASDTNNTNYTVVGDTSTEASDQTTWTLTPGVRVVYLITMAKPYRLPEFWPFNGREMKLTQAVRFDNDFHVAITQSHQDATTSTLEDTASYLYTLVNQLSYNVLDNVKVNFSLEQNYDDDPYASQAVNQPGGYYSLKISLGMEATF
jgi:hypothetical protein